MVLCHPDKSKLPILIGKVCFRYKNFKMYIAVNSHKRAFYFMFGLLKISLGVVKVKVLLYLTFTEKED